MIYLIAGGVLVVVIAVFLIYRNRKATGPVVGVELKK